MRRNDRPSLRASSGTKPLNRGVMMRASLLLRAHSGAFAARPWQGLEAAVHGDSSLFTRSSQNNPVTPESIVTAHRHRAILFSSHAAPKTADSSLCLHASLCSKPETSDLDPRTPAASFVPNHSLLSSPCSLWVQVYTQDCPMHRGKASYYPNLSIS